MKLRHRVGYLNLILILVLTFLITGVSPLSYEALLIGIILCILTLLLALQEGFLGTLIAVVLNITGSALTLRSYSANLQQASLIVAGFQIGTTIACLIIGWLSIKEIKYNELLKQRATVDMATNTYTMNAFNERYGQIIEHVEEVDRIGFMVLDVDKFDDINKSIGYARAQSMMKSICLMLKKATHDKVDIYRLGVSEILMLSENASREEMLEMGKNVHEGIADSKASFVDRTIVDKFSISLGCSVYPDMTEDIRDLVNDAYAALRHSKNTGENNIHVYSDVFEELKDLVHDDRELEIAVKMTLLTVKHKDLYTYEHSFRVASYTYDFALWSGVDPAIAEKYKIAALLHDIGKINIHMTVLNKEGKLSDEEYEEIKNHPWLGSDMISKIPSMSEYAPVALYHHERYDGYGYPEGISGSEIPYGARIICIADAVDAMVSNRPYQKAMKLEEVRNELERCAGKQFDPEMVPGFIAMLEEQVRDKQASRGLDNNTDDSSLPKVQLQSKHREACDFFEKCPIYMGRQEVNHTVLEGYKRRYCAGDFHECARFRVSTNRGKVYVARDLMPDMKERADRIIEQV